MLGHTVEIQQFEPRGFFAQGDTVVVLGHERMRLTATGRIAENDWVMVVTLRDGRAVRFREYDDTAAVAAALSCRLTSPLLLPQTETAPHLLLER